MNKVTIDDVRLRGKRVLVRVDFNVPMEEGRITDDKRITESLPTINKILKDGGRAILMSHLGRPDGKKKSELSLRPVAGRLSELIHKPVHFAPDC
ncbi:MAG: phosphoglycerate kinase, partial [Ignavibacteria bacterium]